MPSDDSLDHRVRLAAFQFLEDQTQLRGEVLPRGIVAQGFVFEGQRVPLIGPQGIFKPAVLAEMPLSITTVPEVEGKRRPYDDQVGDEGLVRYRYRGTDPGHRDNVGLRLAMQRRAPLIYLYGVVPGRYMPSWPVYVVGDDPRGLCFTIAMDDRRVAAAAEYAVSEPEEVIRRSYVTRLGKQRMHQQMFRQRVLRAYREQCAICRLRHEELLDAAHILPDGHPRGEPVVPNGLALCKLHHAAFDRHILGVRPDLTVELRPDVLREPDGPMLKYGLQGFQDAHLLLPRDAALRPNLEFVEERYGMFRKAG
jgi:putative restriction endonuclease